MRFEPSERLKLLPPYLFAELEMRVSEMRERGETVYDLSIGDPDLPTPREILEVMHSAASRQENQGYSSSSGEQYFREAVANWYQIRFGLELDPSREICGLIGSKEGIANIARAFINPGDKIIVPNPSYPVYANGAAILTGGKPIVAPLLAENGFLPNLESIDPSGAKLMFLNYPNNPTGAMANLDFLKAAVDFARDNGIILCYDNAYSELVFGSGGARSILEVPGALECCIEFNSCSKTFSMTGSRIAFATGTPELISGLARVKSQIDSGPVPFIQRAAAFALSLYKDSSPPQIVREYIEIYRRRMSKLVNGLNSVGLDCSPSPATFYLWVSVGGSSLDFAMKLLKLGIVITPGIGFGEHGEGFVRFALTKDEETIALVIETLREAGID